MSDEIEQEVEKSGTRYEKSVDNYRSANFDF